MLDANAPPFVPRFLQPGGQPQIGGPPQAAPQPQPVPPPGNVVVYQNGFDNKHVTANMTATTAVERGKARTGNPRFSTVFSTDFLHAQVSADAANRNAGNYELSIACHLAPPGAFALAENKGGKWKSFVSPMFFCKIFYRLAIGIGGGRTITLYHLETDF